MLKTLLAGTALASFVALGAQAQQTSGEPETTPPAAVENQLPSSTSAEPAAPMAPQAADESGAAPAPDASGTTAPDALAEEPAAGAPVDDVLAPVDLATVSADTLIGADIRTHDQDTIASVEDVVMSPDGMIENVVARFGGFLGFGETKVLVGLDEITAVKDAVETVFLVTSLTPEALKERPEYTPPEG